MIVSKAPLDHRGLFLRRMDSDLIRYMVENQLKEGDRIPALSELSSLLSISVSKLREQLEVARILGLVEVKPRTGIRCKGFDFMPALRLSLFYALASERSMFDLYSNLRIHVETAYWKEAVNCLGAEDLAELRTLVETAWAKLRGNPITIPHEEHRRFHMGIFRRLEHPFVQGILESYWEAYEAIELNRYAEYAYLEEVWTYHEKILNEIEAGNDAASLQAFMDHTQLLGINPISKGK